jgi:XRE family transcriptional regulator, regulator of sulfur utilization
MQPVNDRLGGIVRQLREARGWSQEKLAERADLNRSYLGEIERGQATASLITVFKLADAFDIPPSALVSHCEQALCADCAQGLPA